VAEERTIGREDEPAKAAADGRARLTCAALGAAVSVGLLLFYYLPGLRKTNDAGEIFFLMLIPAAALMLPWALLALLLRVKTVWILCGLLMIYVIGQTSVNLADRAEDDLPSIFEFFFTFVATLIYVGIATVIDLAIRGARRARRTSPTTSPTSDG
jgi:hypothetical protein